ncbi:hypothetical protein JHK82_034009 [Glycine max]|uniref:CCHC-type domain-containing protein n=1 Tax=Glycine max TaxID=3847 RepID=K7LUV1_SOYBN|nr:hypothetical protein JHK85_034719 [Glycine max]KAG4986389.1 hypothetical protein JHK86_034080 [Glycine max]KAG5119589.1 hypothetical protein JHK82_034009 [Glycine max]KAG5140578.1 hypothetical protein JHK84_034346 [Glycine max]KAH1143396.1 hypothetical protein GYH30_033895 [Glycine max]
MCLRDIRHNKCEDSLIGTIETSLGQGPVYFNCYPNKTMSLMDRNILDSLFLNIHFYGLDMKEGSIPAALIYRIQYKVMNTCASRVLLKPQKGETTLLDRGMGRIKRILRLCRFEFFDKGEGRHKRIQATLFFIDITKANVSLPKTIKWDEVTLPEKWVTDKATPSISGPTPTIEQRKQDNSGKIKDDELIQSELPPTTQYQLPKVKDSSDKPIMATPFKTKDVNKEITPKDIRSLTEQANYTTNTFSKKAKQKFRKLRKQKSPTEEVGDRNSELLSKINSLLKTIPETPQPSEESSKIRTRHTSKLINAINKDSDNNSEQVSKEGSMFEKVINPINTKHWKTPSKLYYQRPTDPDLLLEERGENNFKIITNDDNEEIPDTVNTLIFTIVQHFIGDSSLWKDRSAKLLSNLKVYTREDSQQPFWKENFLVGLPRSLGDKVRDKIHNRSTNGDIPYDNLSYGQLISYVQKVALKICQDDKIQRQLAKEKSLNKRDLGSFCEQFGLSACPKQMKKQNPKMEFQKKHASKRRFLGKKYSDKSSTNKEINVPKSKTKVVCYNCEKQGHISKYCKLKRKLRNLSLDPSIEEQINNLLIETSKEETGEVSSEENLNQIQQDDRTSSSEEEDTQEINTLTKEQDILFEAINSIQDPLENNIFLNKLKKSLENKPKPKEFITNNKFDVKINNLKQEVKELSDSDNEVKEEDECQDDEIFMGLINKIKIQKCYINVRIIINDFVLDTMALFDTGADSNCILGGLIPTNFFEETSKKLSTTSGSK